MKRRGSIGARFFVTKGLFILLLVQLTPETYAGVLTKLRRIQLLRLAFPSIIPWNETRCYGELGCLTIDESFRNSSNEATNLLPKSRKSVNTKFILYNRVHRKKGKIIGVADSRSINRTRSSFEIPIKFIIHGFTSSSRTKWVKKMKNELLKHENCNVIIVDWKNGADEMYPQSAANTKLVGLEIAYLIKHLRTNHRLKLEDVHLIGHSLGAHTAGFAGEELKGKIGRITGMDPAKPYFESMPVNHRLDPNDARFVDIIHTSTKGLHIPGLRKFGRRMALGIQGTCGHLDFYPNGGQTQPGCSPESTSNFFSKIKNHISKVMRCNHGRAVDFFIDSINSKCQFLAISCRNYSSFSRGECFGCSGDDFDNCAIMGYHVDTSPALKSLMDNERNATALIDKKFFLSTSGETPFCRRVLRFTLMLRQPSIIEKRVNGSMTVTVHEQGGIVRSLIFATSELGIRKGLGITFIMQHATDEHENLDFIEKIGLSWNSTAKRVRKLHVANVVIEATKLPDERNSGFSITLCPKSERKYEELRSNNRTLFTAC